MAECHNFLNQQLWSRVPQHNHNYLTALCLLDKYKIEAEREQEKESHPCGFVMSRGTNQSWVTWMMKEWTTEQESEKEGRGGTEQRGQMVWTRPQALHPPTPHIALVPYFSRNVVAVYGFLLQKHVKTAFVLGERVTGDPANKTHKHIVECQLAAWGGEHTKRQVASEKHTDLLMNCSKPTRRSSMKESSKRPSSWRNGSCLFSALPGRDGTTICKDKQLFFVKTTQNPSYWDYWFYCQIFLFPARGRKHIKHHKLGAEYDQVIRKETFKKKMQIKTKPSLGFTSQSLWGWCVPTSLTSTCTTVIISFYQKVCLDDRPGAHHVASPCCLSPAHSLATQSRCIVFSHKNPSVWK